MTGDVISTISTAILLPDYNPLTHARTSDVIEAVVNGVPSRVFALRKLSYDEQVDAVQAARRAAYPSETEQLDAAYHARTGNPVLQEAVDAAIAAVKARYPLPVQPEEPPA